MIFSKTQWLGLICLCASLLPQTGLANFTINLNAGALRQNSTTALNSTTGGGALLLLIASGATDGKTFSTPVTGQYTGGNDAIIANFGFNDNGDPNSTGLSGGGTAKVTLNSLTITTPVAVSNSSAYIELRWYPSISLTDYTNGVKPTAATPYGLYNPLIVNPHGTNTINQDGDAWQLVSSGAIGLNFRTTDAPNGGGSQDPSEGYASVPEPSVGVLTGLALIIVVGTLRLRLRKANS